MRADTVNSQRPTHCQAIDAELSGPPPEGDLSGPGRSPRVLDVTLTFFVVAGGTLLAVAANDGERLQVRSADSVAVSPDGRELIVVRNAAGIRW